MENAMYVAIVGTSVVMAGIARALRARAGLLVHVVNVPGDLLQLAEQGLPDILIFDLAAADAVRAIFASRRPLTLIGIDLAGQQAVTYFGVRSGLHSLDDLQHLIDVTTASMIAAPRSAA